MKTKPDPKPKRYRFRIPEGRRIHLASRLAELHEKIKAQTADRPLTEEANP
jgi:hypothetical protein